MLTQNLALDDASGDEITFNLQSYLSDGARRIDVASTPTEPRALEIKHTASGIGANAVDRHLVSASTTLIDGAGVPRKGIVNLTLTQARSSVITNSVIYDLLAAIIDLVADGGFTGSGLAGTTNAAALLRGES